MRIMIIDAHLSYPFTLRLGNRMNICFNTLSMIESFDNDFLIFLRCFHEDFFPFSLGYRLQLHNPVAHIISKHFQSAFHRVSECYRRVSSVHRTVWRHTRSIIDVNNPSNLIDTLFSVRFSERWSANESRRRPLKHQRRQADGCELTSHSSMAFIRFSTDCVKAGMLSNPMASATYSPRFIPFNTTDTPGDEVTKFSAFCDKVSFLSWFASN